MSGPDRETLRGYVICGEQRSGSSYLCEVLTLTGVLGRPLDYFNGPGMLQAGRHDYPQDAESQLRLIVEEGATENGVYGLKMFGATFDTVAASRWTRRLPNLKFVSLTRRDLLGQAISSVRAAQTGQYSAYWAAERKPSYDSAAILDELHRLALGQARWAAFFARCGIAPLCLDYEDVATDPQAAAEAIAALLGVDERVNVDPARIHARMQRDAISLDWRARFIADRGDVTRLDRVTPASFRARLKSRLRSERRRLVRRGPA